MGSEVPSIIVSKKCKLAEIASNQPEDLSNIKQHNAAAVNVNFIHKTFKFKSKSQNRNCFVPIQTLYPYR